MSATNPQRPRHHVGIDVSKERLDVCLMPDGEAFSPSPTTRRGSTPSSSTSKRCAPSW
jgi:hypothetical protein